jgi:streptogramin lyase
MKRISLCTLAVISSLGVILLSRSAQAQDMFATGYGTNPGNIYRVTPAGTTSLFASISGVSGLLDIAVGSSGDLFVGSTGNNTIYKVTPAGAVSTFATTTNPFGMTFDGSGNLMVINESANTISKITPGGSVSLFASSGLFNLPHDIVKNSSGDFFVPNFNTNSVLKVTSAGVVSTFATGFNTPRGITIDPSGNLYVSNGDGSISKVTPAAAVSTYVAAGSVNGGYGLTFDTSLNLYGGDWTSGKVKKITPGGVVSNYNTSGVTMTNPAGVAFAPAVAAPEPGTMALLSLGGMSLLTRRRKK